MIILIVGENCNSNKISVKGGFYSKIDESKFSLENYEYAQQFWLKISIQNLQEHVELYLMFC